MNFYKEIQTILNVYHQYDEKFFEIWLQDFLNKIYSSGYTAGHEAREDECKKEGSK